MEDKKRVLKSDDPKSFNAYIPNHLLEEVRKQQNTFPALKPSEIIANILSVYYKKEGAWYPPDIDSIHEEPSPPPKRMKKNRQSFK